MSSFETPEEGDRITIIYKTGIRLTRCRVVRWGERPIVDAFGTHMSVEPDDIRDIKHEDQ